MTPEQQRAVLDWLSDKAGLDDTMLARGLPALGGRTMRQAIADGDVAEVLRTIQPELSAWCTCEDEDDNHDCFASGCNVEVEAPRYELVAYPLTSA